MTAADSTSVTVPEAVRELPLSARAVYLAISFDGPLTFQALTRLIGAESTAADGLARLSEEGVVTPEQVTGDHRRQQYRLA